ncbi:UbiA family prenyltransferase [Flavobacteriaceae bacterium]|nr:UbiA family prenyltransferase [Flavobacteriaceae bacterium]
MISFAQLAFCYVLGLNNYYFFLVGTFLIVWSSNTINDYFDQRVDLVNQRNNIFFRISHKKLLLISAVIAQLFALVINYNQLIYFCGILSCTLLLWIYNIFLKKYFAFGNVVVALVSVLSLLLPFYADNQALGVSNYYILFSSIFLLQLIREILKDIQDVKGDYKFNYHTLIISLGMHRTKTILIILNAIYLINLVYCVLWINTDKWSRIYILFPLILMGIIQSIWVKNLNYKNSKINQLLVKLSLFFGIFLIFLVS